MAIMKVLVVGGGIGGITCMLALRQHGVDAQLFEQAAAFGQVGAGIQVSSNAARILLKLGLGAALKKVATYPEARDYRGWDTGERLYYTPLGQKAEAHFGSPYYAAHRAELLDVLLGELDEYGITLGSRVECVDQDDRGVTLTLADGTTAQGDILVAADGIHSTVRAQLFGKESPRYTGNVAWRGLDPADHRRSQFGQRGWCLDGAKPQHRSVLRFRRPNFQLDWYQPLASARTRILAGRGQD